MRRFIHFVRCLYQFSMDDELPERSAALAFYAMFSIFPLILLSTTGIGYLLQDEELVAQLTEALTTVLPGGGAIIGSVIDEVLKAQGVSGIIGVLTLLWGASGFFHGLQGTVNHIFTSKNTRPGWLGRILGILMAIAVGALLLGFLFIATASRLIFRILPLPPESTRFWDLWGNQLIVFFLGILTFTLLYRYVPRRRPRLRHTLIGAVAAAVGWLVATYGMLWYVASGLARYNLIYGSIAALIIFLLWLYISNMILLLGAELTAYLSHTKDCTPLPLPEPIQRFLEARLGPLEDPREPPLAS